MLPLKAKCGGKVFGASSIGSKITKATSFPTKMSCCWLGIIPHEKFFYFEAMLCDGASSMMYWNLENLCDLFVLVWWMCLVANSEYVNCADGHLD